MSSWLREKLPTDGREEAVGQLVPPVSSRGDTLTCKDWREENFFSLLRMMESFVYTQKV